MLGYYFTCLSINDKGIYYRNVSKYVMKFPGFDLMLLNKNVLLIIQKCELNVLSILQRLVENVNRK